MEGLSARIGNQRIGKIIGKNGEPTININTKNLQMSATLLNLE